MCEATLDPPTVGLDPSSDACERPTIGQIFRRFGPAYRQKSAHRMSRDQLQVMAALESCRTKELGSVHY